jgi:glycosyltransferase involved in cell wall biosynthesis
MKILFLIPYPLAKAPSQRFRFEQYLALLRQHNYEFTVQSFWDVKGWDVLYRKGHVLHKLFSFLSGVYNRIKALFQISNFDYVFIHREVVPIGPPVFEWMIVKIFKKKVIYDFDDAIWIPNTSEENKIVSFLKWHSKVKQICKWSYAVSCGNPFLADFARLLNSHTVINPTTIDTVLLHNPELYPKSKNKNKITIGWTGTHSTLKYLDQLLPVIARLEEKYGDQIELLVIANTPPLFKIRSLKFIPWHLETEIKDLSQVDIGIMPLTDDLWAKGKCGFKILQYLALEIPALASPIGVNSEIISDQVNGYLCATHEDWYGSLDRLIQSDALRDQIGKNGRQKVISNYSVRSNASTFLSLFE